MKKVLILLLLGASCYQVIGSRTLKEQILSGMDTGILRDYKDAINAAIKRAGPMMDKILQDNKGFTIYQNKLANKKSKFISSSKKTLDNLDKRSIKNLANRVDIVLLKAYAKFMMSEVTFLVKFKEQLLTYQIAYELNRPINNHTKNKRRMNNKELEQVLSQLKSAKSAFDSAIKKIKLKGEDKYEKIIQIAQKEVNKH